MPVTDSFVAFLLEQYYSVPAAILEDGDALMRWAAQSVAVARAQRASPPKRKPVARQAR